MPANNLTISAHPKIVYWVGMPNALNSNDRIDLLKRDIHVKKLDAAVVDDEKIQILPDCAVIYYFDTIAASHRAGKIHTVSTIANKILKHGEKHAPGRIAVHTTMIDDSLTETFRKAGVPLVQKNLDYRTHALGALLQLVQVLFRDDSRLKRQYLRLEFNPHDQFNALIRSKQDANVEIKGFVKDLSLNGVGLMIDDVDELAKLKLKDPVELDLTFYTSKVPVQMGFITRLYAIKNEVGVSFNIRNESMVSKKAATEMHRLLDQWLRDVQLPTDN